MIYARMITFSTLVACFVVGCGSGDNRTSLDQVDATGSVTVDGEPAYGVELTFVPSGDTPGNGGLAKTDESGQFTATSTTNKPGLPPGNYKVSASWRLLPDGKPDLSGAPEIESQAVEVLPANYLDPDRSKLTATVSSGGEPMKFELKGAKKKK